MTLVQIIPIIALVSIYVLALAITYSNLPKSRGFWVFWAIYAVAYGAFSVWAIAEDGMMQFYVNHSQDLIGNQVWIDLLVAVAIGWLLILPEARARGMNITPWLIFIMVTATIGFGAMIARLLYLRARDANAPA